VTIYFANPVRSDGDRVVKAMIDGQLAFIDTPEQGNKRPYGVMWCADNGKYSPSRYLRGEEWDEDQWWDFLVKHAEDADTCAFATAPDVLHWHLDEDGKPYCIGDADATLVEGKKWYAKIRELGYQVALVAQDGLDPADVPWDDIDVIFIGGSDDYKVGTAPPPRKRPLKLDGTPLGTPGCLELVAEAKRRGKWVHMGRVNSRSRYRFAHAIGCDSADGTYLTFGNTAKAENLPDLLDWIAETAEKDLIEQVVEQM
jgi:hypothetical protein